MQQGDVKDLLGGVEIWQPAGKTILTLFLQLAPSDPFLDFPLLVYWHPGTTCHQISRSSYPGMTILAVLIDCVSLSLQTHPGDGSQVFSVSSKSSLVSDVELANRLSQQSIVLHMVLQLWVISLGNAWFPNIL